MLPEVPWFSPLEFIQRAFWTIPARRARSSRFTICSPERPCLRRSSHRLTISVNMQHFRSTGWGLAHVLRGLPAQARNTRCRMSRLRLERLSRRYGDFLAVDDVSLDVADGEFVTLLG